MQSPGKPQEVTVEEVNTGEMLDENAEMEECITKHITHISWVSTTKAFGTTMEASSTEEYAEQGITLEPISADPNTTFDTTTADPDTTLDTSTKDTETTIKPTSTEEYSEASLSELKRGDVPKVL